MALSTRCKIEASRIYYDKEFNCRADFTPQSCLDLALSIKQHGLQFPIIIQPAKDVEGDIPEEYDYRLVIGHRRFTAMTQLLNWKVVPVEIRSGLSEKEARVLNLVENLERKDITLMDESKALRAIFPEGTPFHQMAKETSKSYYWCRIRWLIPTLPKEIQQDCAAGRLGVSDIEVILTAEDKYKIALAKEIKLAKRKGESVRQRQRRFADIKRAKGRQAIRRMLTYLMSEEIEVSPYRALAWASGDITDEDFLKEPL